jgi:nucleoside-diphosphate-sugar epimerase
LTATAHYDFFVTGGSSPIGSYFVRQLQGRFPRSSIVYSRRSRTASLDHLDSVDIDFSEGQAEILNQVNFSCEKIIHLASCTPGNCKEGTPEEFFAANVAGPTAVFRVLFERGAKSLYYLSSTAVYNKFKSNYLYEYSEKTTNNYYGLSKLLFEQSSADLSLAYNTRTLGVRVPVLLTHGVKNNFISKWCDNLIKGNLIEVSNPDSLFNAVCPDWALWELYSSFEASEKDFRSNSEVTNIFASELTTLREVLSTIANDRIEVRESEQVPQLISTIHSNLPNYSARVEISKFLAANHSPLT